MRTGLEILSHSLPFLMIVTPLVGALLTLAVSANGLEAVRRTVLTNVLLTFAMSVLLVVAYDAPRESRTGLPQMVTSLRWLGEVQPAMAHHPGSPASAMLGPNIRLAVGVDGLSLWLVALPAVLMVSIVLMTWRDRLERPAVFYALLLTSQSCLVGLFASLDVILFFIFLEFLTVPLYLLIGMWGGPERRPAARRFFAFQLAASLLILIGLVSLVLSHSWMAAAQAPARPPLTFLLPKLVAEIPWLASRSEGAYQYWSHVGPWIFLALLAGFIIKTPLFPMHTWLPASNLEAPAAASVVLSAMFVPVGCYGVLRLLLPLFPEACAHASGPLTLLAVIGVTYGALVALAQDDLKKLMAYWSVTQMSLCLFGALSRNAVGMAGAALHLVVHGLTIGGLLLLGGRLQQRYKSREIEPFSGLVHRYPRFTFAFVALLLCAAGMPGLGGFSGQMLILLGAIRSDPVDVLWMLAGLVVLIWAFFWLIQRMFYGPFREPSVEHSPYASPLPIAAPATEGEPPAVLPFPGPVLRPCDLNRRELCALAPLLFLLVWIGISPDFFLTRLEPAITRIALIYDPLPVTEPAEEPVSDGDAGALRMVRTAGAAD